MTKKQTIFLLFFGMFAFNLVALYNGFALTEGDTGAYIDNAMNQSFNTDRPPFYGMFIGLSSLRTTFWYTLFAQALIVTFLLIRLIKLILGKNPDFRLALVIILTITSFTCVSWVVGELMPDIFSGILLLAIILYLTDTSAGMALKVVFIVIIFVATIIHNSHLWIMVLFTLFVVGYALIRKNKTILRHGLVLFTIPVAFWFLMCTMNSNHNNGFIFSKSGHVFLMARLAQMGILKEYLNENCEKKQFKLCAYKDKLPVYTWDYMWGDYSPPSKMGGWDSAKAEDDYIIQDILTSPSHLIKFLQKSFTGAVKQLTKVGVADNNYQSSVLNSAPYWHISAYISNETGEYVSSIQNTKGIDGSLSNLVYYFFFFVTSIWILFSSTTLTDQHKLIYVLVFAFFIINAGITSTLSTVHCRFMNRVFWILPSVNTIIILGYYWRKNTELQTTSE